MASLIEKISKPVLGNGPSYTPRLSRGSGTEAASVQSLIAKAKISGASAASSASTLPHADHFKKQTKPTVAKRSISPLLPRSAQVVPTVVTKKVEAQLKKLTDPLLSSVNLARSNDSLAKLLNSTQPIKKTEDLVIPEQLKENVYVFQFF